MWYHSWGQVKLTEGGKGLKPVDADEDTILRVGVRNGSAAAAHTHLGKVAVTRKDPGLSCLYKLKHGSHGCKPL